MTYRQALPSFLILLMLACFSSRIVYAADHIHLSPAILENDQLPFESHRGNQPFATALAMNIQYVPVKQVRLALSPFLQYDLNFFTGWNKNGEAHITVITPPEYDNILRPYVDIARIEQIAAQYDIQHSDLTVLGLGRGRVEINHRWEETYFIIMHSNNLLKIREQIYQEYLRNGGPAKNWDPKHFYAHITVGYSLRDLHETDGVIKDVAHSLDQRFQLDMTNLLK